MSKFTRANRECSTLPISFNGGLNERRFARKRRFASSWYGYNMSQGRGRNVDILRINLTSRRATDLVGRVPDANWLLPCRRLLLISSIAARIMLYKVCHHFRWTKSVGCVCVWVCVCCVYIFLRRLSKEG